MLSWLIPLDYFQSSSKYKARCQTFTRDPIYCVALCTGMIIFAVDCHTVNHFDLSHPLDETGFEAAIAFITPPHQALFNQLREKGRRESENGVEWGRRVGGGGGGGRQTKPDWRMEPDKQVADSETSPSSQQNSPRL